MKNEKEKGGKKGPNVSTSLFQPARTMSRVCTSCFQLGFGSMQSQGNVEDQVDREAPRGGNPQVWRFPPPKKSVSSMGGRLIEKGEEAAGS